MEKTINAQALSQLLKTDPNLVLIDVRREADARVSAHQIPGAVWKNPEQVRDWASSLGPEKTVVYCVRGGAVSQSVAKALDNGRDALFLEGGFQAWRNGQFPVQPNPLYPIGESDIDLLKGAGMSEEDLAHSLAVAQKALEIASRIRTPLDLTFIGQGALFHDLGKARTHAMEHGKIGAELGASLGLSKAITDVMEKHIRGGLTPEEARELNLPVKDYTLSRLEERIIIYADRLVDIITDGIVDLAGEKEAEDRFEEILSTIPKYGKNPITLARYLGYHREIQGLAGPAH